jgi:hypothetical protein
MTNLCKNCGHHDWSHVNMRGKCDRVAENGVCKCERFEARK